MFMCLFPLLVVGVTAIYTPGGAKQAEYHAELESYPFFVSLYGRGECAGAIIKSDAFGQPDKVFVATAAHCLGAQKGFAKRVKIIFSDGSFALANAAFLSPTCKYNFQQDGPNKCDAALISVDAASVPAKFRSVGLPIYIWGDEKGKTIDIFGLGATGDPQELSTQMKCRQAMNKGGDKIFRRAQNIVESAPFGLLNYRMDCSSPSLLLEGHAGAGDSGGPATLTRGNIEYIAGVNSGSMENNECDCGTIDQYCKLSSHVVFIEEAMAGKSKPSITFTPSGSLSPGTTALPEGCSAAKQGPRGPRRRIFVSKKGVHSSCEARCKMEPTCVAFDFKRGVKRGVCRLYSKRRNKIPLEPRPGAQWSFCQR